MTTEHTNRDRLLAILEFWHRIEFFIPFDLSSRVEEKEGRVSFWLHADSLEDDMESARRPFIPEGKEISGMQMFFGVFDKAEMVERVEWFCRPQDEISAFEDTERASLEGDTCFASLDLDDRGAPIFASFKVSTLPWALGRIRDGDLGSLSSGAFEADRHRLKELLSNFAAQRRLDHPDDIEAPEPLSPSDILTLNRQLEEWADFKPRPDRPIALVEIRFRKKKEQRSVGLLPAPGVLDIAVDSDGEEADGDEGRDDTSDDHEVGILNSFYLEDLERAIACVRDGIVPTALRDYLTPLAQNERIDLYSDGGRWTLLEKLRPRHLNRGRWPSPPNHAMSLMQQFAINVAGQLPDEGGLFSVNGPPGTGKTTLLQDVIADNLVKRARLLAGLKSARAAFDGRSKAVALADGGTVHISSLKRELAGFEMVVASSNNTAVENISRDLPKRKSVWSGSPVEYLQPVAHNVAAQKPNGSFLKLDPQDQSWGLISCVLGNSNNRWNFKQRFANSIGKKKQNSQAWDGSLFQNIWGWLDSYQGPSFYEAATAFRETDVAVETMIADCARFADLFADVGLVSQEEYCRSALFRRQQSQDAVNSLRQSLDRLRQQIETGELDLSALKEEERLLDRAAPAWWYKVLPTKKGRDFKQEAAANSRAQLVRHRELQALRQSLQKLQSDERVAIEKLQTSEAALAERRREWTSRNNEFVRLHEALGHPPVPKSLEELETDGFQIAGLWHSEKLAVQRSKLFSAAMDLHAAWLGEVAQKGGGFKGNIVAIKNLLSGNLPINHGDMLTVWQSFFMIVPVVSTTFASFARQFQGVRDGELGWLFIDEAGQAVPQAAVGALLRSRRVMVIGDPLQIEPVFTLPSAFIKALADQSSHTDSGDYSPTNTSVQTLADAANKYGTTVPAETDEPLWIGSPLRVHRRCIDPMFSLANRIAYHDKMVFAAGERVPKHDLEPFYGESAWIDIKGAVSVRQTVPEQIAFIVAVLGESFRRDGTLPDIYLISPFKETKAALKREIGQANWFGRDGRETAPPEKLAEWLKNRIGTVHTFQGKEEKAVFMVLGTDKSRPGAARWAASKPNLLNVAVTRARNRIFVVGDRDIWRGLPYFREATEDLPPISGQEFLGRLRS